MKASEASFDSLGTLMKFRKTPSTVHSLSPSPLVKNYRERHLINSLRKTQKQLAESLKKYSESLGIQVHSLHYRWDLAKIRWEKLVKYKETLMKSLSKIKNSQDIKYLIIDTENQEEENQSLLVKTEEVYKKLTKVKKKLRSFQQHSKNELLITENQNHYKEKLENLKMLKNELNINLIEIQTYRGMIAAMYEPIKLKLEEIMISKEELLLSLPQENLMNPSIQAEKHFLHGGIAPNSELRKIICSLSETDRELSLRNMEKRKELKSQHEKLEGKLALVRVQQRFINEKKVRIEVVSKELHAISSLFDSASGHCASSKNMGDKIKSKSVMRNSKISPTNMAMNKSMQK